MATLHTITCLASDAPPRPTEKSVTYIQGINGGIVQLGSAPPPYRRQFVAFILDTDLATKYADLMAAKNAATVIPVAGWGISSQAVLLDFQWQPGIHTTLDGATFGVVVTIQAVLGFAVP